MRRVGLDSHYFQISDMTRWSFNKFVFFLKIVYLFMYVWCIGSSLLSMNFLSCGKQKLLFCRVQVSPCGGFYCYGAQVQGLQQLRCCEHRCMGSAVVALRLGCSAACGIFVNEGANLYPLHWKVQIFFLLILRLCGNYC